MKRSTYSRGVLLLAGIGLVVIGLLAGILGMLFLSGRGLEPLPRPQVVERVELGSRTAPPRVALQPDSSVRMAVADAMMLSRTFQEVASHVTPAVVYIQVEVRSSDRDRRDWFLRSPRQSVGSGVIISPQGYIVTNNHVVEDAEHILVTLEDKRQFEARIVGIDPSTDLAVLKAIDAVDMPVAPLGNSEQVAVGEWVIAVGNPFRLKSTVTAGIVSALGRQVNIIEDEFRIEDFIQTDAAINPGNSGGALVNLNGELIGINTAIATESGSYEGYGFAVPVNLVERVSSDLISYGEVQRGLLGVQISQVDAGVASRLGLDRIGGVLVEQVRSGGSADRAGLRSGDVVLSIENRSVNAPNELQSAVAHHRPGDWFTMRVWRQRERVVRDFRVELLDRTDPVYMEWLTEREVEDPMPIPEPYPESPEASGLFDLEDWGIGLSMLDEQGIETFGVSQGVYVAYVRTNSVASEAGLPRNVVVLAVDGVAVDTLDDLLEALERGREAGRTVLFRVRRADGQTAFYEIEIPSDG